MWESNFQGCDTMPQPMAIPIPDTRIRAYGLCIFNPEGGWILQPRLISPRQNRNIIISLRTQPCKVEKICEIVKKKVTAAAHICKKLLPIPPVALLQGSDQRRQLLKRSFLLDELYEGASVQSCVVLKGIKKRWRGHNEYPNTRFQWNKRPFQD